MVLVMAWAMAKDTTGGDGGTTNIWREGDDSTLHLFTRGKISGGRETI
jgi:hypothetical protein